MKKFLLFTLICGLYLPLWSQLTVDVGSNKNICNERDSVYLGGNPTAWGGAPPYTYCWWIEYREKWFPGSNLYHRASTILDDTTSANPRVLYGPETLNDLSCIYLTVTDNNGQTVTDSVSVTGSLFFIHLSQPNFYYYVIPGDSVWIHGLNNPTSLLPASHCLWQPVAGLSGTTLCTDFWAKPDTTTAYYKTLVDTFGCMSDPLVAFIVYMSGPNVPESALSEYIQVYPNPAREYISFIG